MFDPSGSFFQHLHHVGGIVAILVIFGGMALESTAIPVPSEVVLPLAGLWAMDGKFGHGPLGILAAIAIASAGSLAGSALAYGIGSSGGSALLERYGKYVLLPPEHLRAAQEWMKKHGRMSVLLARFAFGFRHASSIAAGSLRMRFVPFLLSTLAGAGVWNTAGILLGYFFGNKVAGLLKWISIALLAVVIAAVIIMVWRSRKATQGAHSVESTTTRAAA